MRSVYVLRHSAREPYDVHLSQAGVRLAREIGESLGPMARVCSSPAQRCIETAVALGFAVQEERDELALPDDDALALELDAIGDFADAVRLSQHGEHVPAYAGRLGEFVRTIVDGLYDHEDALLVTHGGIVEVIAAALAGSASARLGDGAGYCDGVRLMTEDGAAIRRWSVQRLCT